MNHNEQKQFLKTVFPSYDARHHDAFLIAYNKYLNDWKTWKYEVERNIEHRNEPQVLWYEPHKS